MSVQMMGAVISCGPEERTRFCVLLALANYADDFGFAFPSIRTLERDSRCDEKTVRLAILDLEAEGWVYTARKVLNGKSNVYLMNLEKMAVTVPAKAQRNPVFMRLLKKSPGAMTPVFGVDRRTKSLPQSAAPVTDSAFFAPEESAGMEEFSTANPQPTQRVNDESQRVPRVEIAGIACPPNRHEPSVQNRHEPSYEVEPTPLPPKGGEQSRPEFVNTTTFAEAWRGEERELAVGDRLRDGWERVRVPLKADLGSPSVRARFVAIRPDQDDYETCFAQCWLTAIERDRGTIWNFVFAANDVKASATGVVKYRARLHRYLRQVFAVPTGDSVELTVRPKERAREPAA